MQNDFSKVVSAETYKLHRQKTTYIIPVLVVLVAVVMFVVLEFAARRDWMGVPSGYFVASSVIAWMTNVVSLLIVIHTSFLISQEFAVGTIKSSWVRPVTRNQWYAAKTYMAGVTIMEIFVLVVLLVVAIAVFRLGFNDLTEKGYIIHANADLARRLVLTVGLTVWGLWAVTLFVAMISGLFRHPGGAIAAILGAGIVLTVLGAFSAVRPFLLTTYVSLPMEQMIAMSKGLPLPVEWGDLVLQIMVGAGVWMLVTFLIGQRLMRTREITN